MVAVWLDAALFWLFCRILTSLWLAVEFFCRKSPSLFISREIQRKSKKKDTFCIQKHAPAQPTINLLTEWKSRSLILKAHRPPHFLHLLEFWSTFLHRSHSIFCTFWFKPVLNPYCNGWFRFIKTLKRLKSFIIKNEVVWKSICFASKIKQILLGTEHFQILLFKEVETREKWSWVFLPFKARLWKRVRPFAGLLGTSWQHCHPPPHRPTSLCFIWNSHKVSSKQTRWR